MPVRIHRFLGPFLAALGILASLTAPAEACTTFCLRDGGRILFGKNYDWQVEDGLLVVNQRGLARTAADIAGDKPASWVSRYGSVTFNQYGRDFPSGGMNEAGLVIELMWLDGVRYPTPDRRPAVDVLQWIQYNLDRHATVAEVLAADQKVRIASEVPLHYLVADRKGQVATIEFLDGRLVAHTGKDLPVAALTNSTYRQSEAFRQSAKERGTLPPGPGSLERFARAADRVAKFEGRKGDAVAYAFETLDQVAQGSFTKWSIVYEIDRGKIHFRTQSHRPIRTLSLAGLDFACGHPVRVLSLGKKVEGDVARHLVPYTREINGDLVEASFRKTPFLASVPDAEVQRVVTYPEAAVCRR